MKLSIKSLKKLNYTINSKAAKNAFLSLLCVLSICGYTNSYAAENLNCYYSVDVNLKNSDTLSISIEGLAIKYSGQLILLSSPNHP